MQISNSILIKIIEQAKTLSEILDSDLVFNKSQERNALADDQINEWCQIVAKGDWEQFKKRLAWDNLDLNQVRTALKYVGINNDKNIPEWAETLSECIKETTSLDYQRLKESLLTNRYLDRTTPLPFEDVLSPFVCVAIKKVKKIVGSSYNLLSEDAHASLERSLLRWLSRLSSLCLELEFSIFRKSRQPKLTYLLNKYNNNFSRKYYQEFVETLLTGGLIKFFQEYSMLARLMPMAIDMWVDATQEFILRFESDKLEIQQTFKVAAEINQVIAIKPGLSDRHNRRK